MNKGYGRNLTCLCQYHVLIHDILGRLTIYNVVHFQGIISSEWRGRQRGNWRVQLLASCGPLDYFIGLPKWLQHPPFRGPNVFRARRSGWLQLNLATSPREWSRKQRIILSSFAMPIACILNHGRR